MQHLLVLFSFKKTHPLCLTWVQNFQWRIGLRLQMCFKRGPVSTCLSGSEPVVYRASPPLHFYCDCVSLKVTDHKIIPSSQTSFLVCCEEAAPSLSLTGRPQHRSPFGSWSPDAGEDRQPGRAAHGRCGWPGPGCFKLSWQCACPL